MTQQTNNLDIERQHLVWKRALITFCITIIYITLTRIPLPYIMPNAVNRLLHYQNVKLLQILTMLSGGNLQHISVLLVGLTPFITVQLIMQALQMGISKRLKELSMNPNGQQKINYTIKIITIPLTFIQAFSTLLILTRLSHGDIFASNRVSIIALVYLSLIITTSTLIVVWMSDLNTLYGLGNGINYLIACSVIVNLVENSNIKTPHFNEKTIMLIILGIIGFIIYNVICIWYQSSSLELPIQFAQLDSSVDNLGKFPFSLNIANVMPVILAGMVMNILCMTNLYHDCYFRNLINFKSWHSIAFYTVLLIIFTYIFTFVQFMPSNLDERLDRMNTYIVGVDPTLQTVSYLRRVLFALATFNIVFLLIMVVIPMIVCKLMGLSESLVLSSSSIVIVVTSEIDIRQQVKGLQAAIPKESLVAKYLNN